MRRSFYLLLPHNLLGKITNSSQCYVCMTRYLSTPLLQYHRPKYTSSTAAIWGKKLQCCLSFLFCSPCFICLKAHVQTERLLYIVRVAPRRRFIDGRATTSAYHLLHVRVSWHYALLSLFPEHLFDLRWSYPSRKVFQFSICNGKRTFF